MQEWLVILQGKKGENGEDTEISRDETRSVGEGARVPSPSRATPLPGAERPAQAALRQQQACRSRRRAREDAPFSLGASLCGSLLGVSVCASTLTMFRPPPRITSTPTAARRLLP